MGVNMTEIFFVIDGLSRVKSPLMLQEKKKVGAKQ
jgi:hypothetical protein